MVQEARIIDVGKSADVRAKYPHANFVDAAGMLIIPGLIDGHNHPAHYLSKGLLDDMEVKRRWSTRLYPFEAGMIVMAQGPKAIIAAPVSVAMSIIALGA